MIRGLAIILLAATVAATVAAAAAQAEVLPGNIPAASIQTAVQTTPGVTYRGGFQPDTSTYHDLDYLAFSVAKPGEAVEVTLQNTTASVNPNDYEWCPVYLSILNQANTIVSSGAGTIATYGDTESFDWTFSSPGTYYVVMESNGDMPAGDPTYAVSYTVPSGNSPPVTPLVRELRVPRRQRGRVVRATVVLGQAGPVAAVLRHGRSVIATIRRGQLAAGSSLALRIPAAFQRHRRLSLELQITVAGRSYTRPVTLIL